MARKRTAAVAPRRRVNELKKILEDRRRELAQDVQGRIRGARAEDVTQRQSVDQGEVSELDTQDEIEFALLQMKTDTLNRIDAALHRLDEGSYGNCVQCGDEIAEARLRALPFAVRCKGCEEALETDEEHQRYVTQRSASLILFEP
jgi:DnaK suppressor protein